MAANGSQQPVTTVQKLANINERTWLTMGNLAEMMTDYEKSMNCYEAALRHNPYSIEALTQIASLCRGREQFARAVEYFKRILSIQENSGDTWAALGHCYLMMDNLQDAYHAYQQALYHLSNPKDPKLWYGIGILYDRYGSLEHAEEAFSAVMKMDPKFEKANEIYFRLGIIYKQQQKFDLSLSCFRYILHSPPRPLTESDIWFQTGHVYEQQKEYEQAKEAYERVLAENPDHAKVLQQLGWLYHQQNTSFCNQSAAINYLTRSLKSDSADAQSWYLLGRCYMAEQNYNKAYEAYQQAVYRDARNPTFWCSIGVLYYQINQYRDALDAYSRAIRLNPYISEVWYDLGTLYESCNNQIQDALDAYQRAAELDPSNPHIKQRLELLRKSQSHAPQGPGNAPPPQDVSNPSQYQPNANAQPLNGAYGQGSAPSGPPNAMNAYHTSTNPAGQRVEDRGPPPLPMTLPHHDTAGGRDLPLPSGPPQPSPTAQSRRSPGPYPFSNNRDDVRIPDIGNGGGRAPTPSDRSQMNPIMSEPTRPSPSGPQGPPAPYNKSPQEGLRSPGSNPMMHSPHAKSSHASPKQYEHQNMHPGHPSSHAIPPHSAPPPSHRSPAMAPSEQHHPPHHGYEPHRPDYDRRDFPPAHRQELHSPSPTTYQREQQPSHAPHPPLPSPYGPPSSASRGSFERARPTSLPAPPEEDAKPYQARPSATASPAKEEDHDASAADMLLSIGQSRGDKRTFPPDDHPPLDEVKRLRPNNDLPPSSSTPPPQEPDRPVSPKTSPAISPSEATAPLRRSPTPPPSTVAAPASSSPPPAHPSSTVAEPAQASPAPASPTATPPPSTSEAMDTTDSADDPSKPMEEDQPSSPPAQVSAVPMEQDQEEPESAANIDAVPPPGPATPTDTMEQDDEEEEGEVRDDEPPMSDDVSMKDHEDTEEGEVQDTPSKSEDAPSS
ncbi:TPR-like protein [Hesseltinella vesiculosa]|uniref:TPR-like protein n=1 Tax=Hesseltinella vesiculosa TaxID=101127 RepID=A0A1X2GCW9_9FUNG|nr:TPR-like protein [Hesseltinella vesiculosa]